ncbi:DEAD/DEAH box helicase [Sphaerisporangium rhizosphaerae]|uniref:DEAD/DEAH box helicase n=1 Tax=Sphaerisporangium rhizosphaerae TaxID=2269375 RepID=A0ABW2NVS2_9ACTN
MTTVRVFLPGPVAVIPSQKVRDQLAPRLRPAHLVDNINALARAGALPARMEEKHLAVYTDTHVVGLYVTELGDAYRLGWAAPRGFRDEERLLRGALLLGGAAGWHEYHQIRDVPRGVTSSHMALLRQAWADANRLQPPPPRLPPRHTEYLDLMEQVIEAGRDIEVARQRAEPPIHYRRRESTREERRSASGVYAFTLVRPTTLAAGAVVHLADQPELRGKVKRLEGTNLVVRFDGPIDYGRIPAQGALTVMPSDLVFRAQADAVAALRRGEVSNPEMLRWFVDRQLAPFRTDPMARPRRALDPGGQLPAFQKALAVPDVLLILGPPGTGKTRTITEIVAACTARGERVLVTSHTNRAVDNVLQQLPEDIRTVRVGNEDAMTGRARELMVENHVTAAREHILAATQAMASRLAVFTGEAEAAGRWLVHLTDSLDAAHRAEQEAAGLAASLDHAVRRAQAPLAGRLAATGSRAEAARAAAERLRARESQWEQRHARAHARAGAGPLAFFHRWLADRRLGRLHAVRRRLGPAHAELADATAAHDAVRAEADRLVAADPEATGLIGARDAAVGRRKDAAAEAGRSAEMLWAMVAQVVPVPPLAVPDDLAAWRVLRDQFGASVRMLRGRAGLLAEWRDGIGDAELDLQREFVRYADVVAATCIGTATSKLLAELQFDLAIVDEAGQISTPNLLVPLIRAKRCVLVGDHMQLPPYLDDEVRQWRESLARDAALPREAAREIGELLRHSAFERLYGTVPPDHQVMLAVQRRMPQEIGRFVSDAFYQGSLLTDHSGGGGDPVFTSPFAMVDTADLSAGERGERSAGRGEGGNGHGWVNPLEADLIVRLVTRYARHYRDWAVILPYRAQAERIRAGLRNTLGDGPQVADNVGTVDSFQGGERDLIVYGFTGSNPRGEVGFLTELRRLNVAVSRAKWQLVLVGDTTTLGAARDEGFRALMGRMLDHLGEAGDRRPSAEVRARLDRAEGEFL